MNPTKVGVIPKASAACCTDSTKISLTSATRTVTTASVARAKPQGPRFLSFVGVLRTGEEFAVSLQGEQHAECVGGDQQNRQTQAERLSEYGARRRFATRGRRRDQQRDRGQEEQACLHAGADAVVFLHVVFQSAEQK